ncbi:MAG: ATP-binding cassette domain-containing protein, partial [Oscillospiraceae bacterium]|nr:ATP-binding cassette domain-containing protein [Oscillospiraceae bacterium]
MMLTVEIRKKLDNFTLDVQFETDREILALLGASGCGKSMTLKCIAGIEKPDEGRIVLNDRVLFDSEKGINLSPQMRRVGYLFQQYALFPNMTVEKNIAAGCMEKNKEMKKRLVAEKIKKMHISGLEHKYPYQLSGGQQQR